MLPACLPDCLAAWCVTCLRLLVPVPVQVACLALYSGVRSEQWTPGARSLQCTWVEQWLPALREGALLTCRLHLAMDAQWTLRDCRLHFALFECGPL